MSKFKSASERRRRKEERRKEDRLADVEGRPLDPTFRPCCGVPWEFSCKCEELAELKAYVAELEWARIENHPNFSAFIRAFWRRIHAVKHQYGAELPNPVPVEFRAHMATAGTLLRPTQEPVTPLANTGEPDGSILPVKPRPTP